MEASKLDARIVKQISSEIFYNAVLVCTIGTPLEQRGCPNPEIASQQLSKHFKDIEDFINMNKTDLSRFISAQAGTYQTALSEIRKGRKQNHWMWYIFPQIKGLGLSETAKFYSIHDLKEAAAYLNDPILGSRLIEISEALLDLPNADAYQIFGSPDDMKLKSSMTLFAAISGGDTVFKKVLEKYFDGSPDVKTLDLIY